MMKKNNTYKNKKMKYLGFKKKTKKKKTYQKKNNNINKNNTINKQKTKKNIKKNVKKNIKNKLSKKKIRSNKIKSKKLKGGTLTLEDKKIKNEIILKVMKNLYEEVQKKKKTIILNPIVLKYKETTEIDGFNLVPKYIPFDKLDKDGKINQKDIKNYVLIINKLIDHNIRYKNNFTSYNNRELFTIDYMEININYLITLFNEATTGVNKYNFFMRTKHEKDKNFINDDIINAVNKPDFSEELFDESNFNFNINSLDEFKCKNDRFRTEEEIKSINQKLISLIEESFTRRQSKIVNTTNNIKKQITFQINLIDTLNSTIDKILNNNLDDNLDDNFDDRESVSVTTGESTGNVFETFNNIIKDLKDIIVTYFEFLKINDNSEIKHELLNFIGKINIFINKINSNDSNTDHDIYKLKKLLFKQFAFNLLGEEIININEDINGIGITRNIKNIQGLNVQEFISKRNSLLDNLDPDDIEKNICKWVESYEDQLDEYSKKIYNNILNLLNIVKFSKAQSKELIKELIKEMKTKIKDYPKIEKLCKTLYDILYLALYGELMDACYTKFQNTYTNLPSEKITIEKIDYDMDHDKQNIKKKLFSGFEEFKKNINNFLETTYNNLIKKIDIKYVKKDKLHNDIITVLVAKSNKKFVDLPDEKITFEYIIEQIKFKNINVEMKNDIIKIENELKTLIKKCTYTGVDNQSNYDESCSICFDPFNKEKPFTKLICKHRFHNDCLSQFFKTNPSIQKSCPLCRRVIPKKCVDLF